MYAIEFEAEIRDGLVRIPEKYALMKNRRARIVVLLSDDEALESELENKVATQKKSVNFSDYPVDAFQEVDGVVWQREQRDAW